MAPDSVDGKLSPEARELLNLFTLQVQNSMQQISLDVTKQVDGLKDHFERRLESHRSEANTHFSEIKSEQRDQRRMIEDQGRDLAVVKTRLDEGEKRFAKLESEVAENKKAIEKGDDKSAENAKGLAYLGGAVAAGAGMGGAVTLAVQSLMK